MPMYILKLSNHDGQGQIFGLELNINVTPLPFQNLPVLTQENAPAILRTNTYTTYMYVLCICLVQKLELFAFVVTFIQWFEIGRMPLRCNWRFWVVLNLNPFSTLPITIMPSFNTNTNARSPLLREASM